MEMKFFGPRLRATQEDRLAKLLNLSRDEYAELSHSGIRKVNDLNGDPLYYYIKISPLNPEYLLTKINMDRKKMVYFSPDAFDQQRQPLPPRTHALPRR
ncbi:hypothetical protein [Taibaiella chishuiensis]|uniref:Uncharacterized protein n=1 Tax=Taibaiella chishuiensis TaxID=1434707 RepID=A0A2P8D359_9BACT|nr:hypothetical protein [Taibaiella chishuiensis]PSK91658.1 hypothetical protein B0I18_105243 [Taibaiella chishuiensis]